LYLGLAEPQRRGEGYLYVVSLTLSSIINRFNSGVPEDAEEA
jgi:hypothetical protein